MAQFNNLLELSDQELVVKIKEDSRYLSVVEKRFKSNCFKFVKWKFERNISEIDLEDMFQDAILALYENIIKGKYTPNFKLQTYMNTVCRNNMSNRLKKNEKKEFHEQKADNFESDYYLELPDNTDYDELITDSLDSNKKTGDDKYENLKNALDKIKHAGGHCYQMLKLFFWEKKSMRELMELYSYKNERTTIQQKAKCQKRLKILMQKEL
jgi:RNA polymerase sigma factor (sigma-70 family)